MCLTCLATEFTKLPFQLSDSYASKPFDLVHLDTWGPYKVCTRGRYRYFLTLVDDHIRMTWLYLMHHKSDFLEKFTTFYHYVQNHFQTVITTISSDNAPEFSDLVATTFYKNCGVTHQTSCPYRPQQN